MAVSIMSLLDIYWLALRNLRQSVLIRPLDLQQKPIANHYTTPFLLVLLERRYRKVETLDLDLGSYFGKIKNQDYFKNRVKNSNYF